MSRKDHELEYAETFENYWKGHGIKVKAWIDSTRTRSDGYIPMLRSDLVLTVPKVNGKYIQKVKIVGDKSEIPLRHQRRFLAPEVRK